MDRWEYYTTLLEADLERAIATDIDGIPPGEHPKYTPYALIPELNDLGAKGWELVHMEPVSPGRNHDVVKPDASSARWARHYFCAFKRKTTPF